MKFINSIRFYLGLFLVGPIAGVLAYALSPKPLYKSAVVMATGFIAIKTGLITLPLSALFITGALVHAFYGIKASRQAKRDNAKVLTDQDVYHPAGQLGYYAVRELREDHKVGPIQRGIWWGLRLANTTADLQGWRISTPIYGWDCFEHFYYGLSGCKPQRRP